MEDIKTHIPGLFQVSLSLLLFHFTVFRCMSEKRRQAGKKTREREDKL